LLSVGFKARCTGHKLSMRGVRSKFCFRCPKSVTSVKNGCRVLCQAVRVKYAFIQANECHHPVGRLCAVLAVPHSGYYA